MVNENPKDLPFVILGKTFKPETNILTGSPAILLKNILEEKGLTPIQYDPYIDKVMPEFEPSVFLIGTKHPQFMDIKFPKGSIVIDPWRYMPNQKGIKVIKIGENLNDNENC
jgi:UDPglucose 6-dehydrogenase